MAKTRSPEELKASPGLISIKEAAGYILMNTALLYTKASRGEISSFKIGRSRRFRIADLEHYIEQQRAA